MSNYAFFKILLNGAFTCLANLKIDKYKCQANKCKL